MLYSKNSPFPNFFLLNLTKLIILALLNNLVVNLNKNFQPVSKSELFLDQKRNAKLIASGFSAASDDYADKKLNLHELLVKNAPATFFMKVANSCFSHLSIFENDLLVVDRSEQPIKNSLVIYSCGDDLMLDRLIFRNGRLSPAKIPDAGAAFEFWGVVTFVIHKTI